MIYKDIEEKIERLRNELYTEIEKSGIESLQTLKVSEKLDELIRRYYILEKNEKIKNNIFFMEYKIAYNQIKEATKKNKKFPTTKEWNKIAKENTYLNNKSIEYISGLNWKEIKAVILKDLNENKNCNY